jgi:hypothetical protein
MLLVPLTSHSVHYILFERMFFFRNITSKGHKCTYPIPHSNRFIFLWTVKIPRTGKRSFFLKKAKIGWRIYSWGKAIRHFRPACI